MTILCSNNSIIWFVKIWSGHSELIYHQNIFDSASSGVQSFPFILDNANVGDVEDAESQWISNDCLFILYDWQCHYLRIIMLPKSI